MQQPAHKATKMTEFINLPNLSITKDLIERIQFSLSSRNAENNMSPTTLADANDPRLKLRIGFNSVNTMRRQLLVTVDENATAQIDYRFDGILYEDQIDDLYWMIENEK